MAAQYLAKPLTRKVLWRTTVDLLDDLIRQEMESGYVAPAYRLEPNGHLFWDDADKFKLTEFKAEALFALIDWLYRNQLSLTLSSNPGLVKLIGKLGPATVRRIQDMCEVMEI